MRSVRCDVCGTKALMAASTCPKCGHGFEVRDGFGEMLPLSHCTTCESYYPQSVGSCKWCGTKPERSPIGPLGPYIWKGLGVLTFASLGIGAWLVKNEKPKPAPRAFVADTLPTNQPKAESFGRKVVLAQPDSTGAVGDPTIALKPTDSARATTVAVSTTDTAQPTSTTVVPASEPVAIQSAGAVAQDSAPPVDNPPADPPPAPVSTPRVTAPSRVIDRPVDRNVDRAPAPAKGSSRVFARSPERTAPRTVARPPARTTAAATRTIAKAPNRVIATAPKSATRSKASGRWITSVARNWAVVRSDPTRQSRIIASIGPNTRVQLGETRGAWRRIKTKGLAGWVEHRTLVATVVASRKTGRLAAR